MKNIYLFTLLVLLLSACSLQKRQYNKGYYISWHKDTNKTQKMEPQSSVLATESNEIGVISASINDDLSFSQPHKTYTLPNDSDQCDVIILKNQNADELKVKITEITLDQVLYKPCNQPNGKVEAIDKSKIFMIKYPNGTKEMFKDEEKNVNAQGKVKTNDERWKTENAKKKVSPFALLSFIFGILTVLTFAVFGTLGIAAVPLVFGGLAVICSIIGFIQIKKKSDKYKGKFLAVLGLIFGLIFSVLSIAFLALVAL